MKITINIKTDNAAFEDGLELYRVLLRACHNIGMCGLHGDVLHDSNGNIVGKYNVTGR